MSNYDGQNPYYGGGGGGGGFVAGGSPFGGGGGGSQGSPGDKKKNANNTVRPVTVKQITSAQQAHPDSDFQIDGHDVTTVYLMGSVRNFGTSATNVNYEVGDGTGYIEARQWLDSADDDSGKMTGIGQDQYVAIMGTLKSFNGKRHVSATHIRPVTDHNEVYHHLLKALWVSLSLRYPGGANGGGGGGGGNMQQGMQSDYAAQSGAGGQNGAANGGVNPNYAHLTPIQRKIMEIISKDTTDEGLHVSRLSTAIGADGEEFGEAIEALMGDGLLFSTIDDLHVRAV